MASSKSFASRITRRALRGLLVILIVAVCGLLIFRMCSQDSIPSSIKHLTVTDPLIAAYEVKGTDLRVIYRPYTEMTYNEDAYGYFSVMTAYFIPEAHEIQIIARYNRSTVKKVANDLHLTEIPDESAEIFDITLLRTAPDGTETRYHASKTLRVSNSIYQYRKLIFEGIDLEDIAGELPSETTAGFFVDFYYKGTAENPVEVDYTQKPIGSVLIFDATEDGPATQNYKLSLKDKTNLLEKKYS